MRGGAAPGAARRPGGRLSQEESRASNLTVAALSLAVTAAGLAPSQAITGNYEKDTVHTYVAMPPSPPRRAGTPSVTAARAACWRTA